MTDKPTARQELQRILTQIVRGEYPRLGFNSSKPRSFEGTHIGVAMDSIDFTVYPNDPFKFNGGLIAQVVQVVGKYGQSGQYVIKFYYFH